jgi:hypothetical protein
MSYDVISTSLARFDYQIIDIVEVVSAIKSGQLSPERVRPPISCRTPDTPKLEFGGRPFFKSSVRSAVSGFNKTAPVNFGQTTDPRRGAAGRGHGADRSPTIKLRRI